MIIMTFSSKIITGKIKRLTKIYADAGFTIEASVIVPLTLIIAVSVIFISFFFHDVISVKSVSSDLILQQAEAYKADTAGSSDGDQEKLQGRLIIADNAGITIEKDKNGIKAVGSCSIIIPLAMVREITDIDNDGFSTSVTISHIDARKEILKYKALADLGNGLITE